jgi:N-acylglucosamine-6-phosphate 2-epimerase
MKSMDFNIIKNGLIVSCQAEGNDPFNTPDGVLLFAKAAIMGGAAGIRTEGFEKTKKIKENVNAPVIGLIKSYFEDGFVRITGSFEDVEKLIDTGCDVIAIDGTFRKREGFTGPDFIKEVKKRYGVCVMADIALYEEGAACEAAGADCLSTTLSGYTPETTGLQHNEPDFNLLKNLAVVLKLPVIAEGRVNTPEYAARMIQSGAWSVVVGTVLTRPRIVTGWFVDAIKNVKY